MNRIRMAIIGTGRMGLPLARRLLDRGYAVSAYNRTRDRAMPLEADGARVVTHTAEALQDATGAIFMLSDAEAVEEVMNAPGVGTVIRGLTVIQMTTVGSQESIRLATQVVHAGGDYLEAPVMGGPGDAEKGDLVNAFASVNYAHGWLDAGARLGLFDVGLDDKLFTLAE